MAKIIEFVKNKPKTTGAIVFAIGAVVVILWRLVSPKPADVAQSTVYATATNDAATIQALAGIQAQADAANTAAANATEQARIGAAAAIESARINAGAAVEIKAKEAAATAEANRLAAEVAQSQIKIEQTRVDANARNASVVTDFNVSTIGTKGTHGVISNVADDPIEIWGRESGYTGLFGNGGLEAFGIAKLGREKWIDLINAL